MNAETRAKETCEQRARDITALMVKKLPGTDIALVMEDQAKCVSLITQALRQAENDKLEEAARVAEHAHLGMSCFVDAVDCGQFNSGVRHAAKAVRSLLEKD